MKSAVVRSVPLVALLCVFTVQSAQAMPPRDGLTVTAGEYDEMSRLGINVIKNPVRDPGKADVRNFPGDVTLLVSGTKQFPVVAIDFPDYAYTYTTTQFDSMLFGVGIWPSGSAREYFRQVSYGEFTLAGTVVGWYQAAQNRAYYGYSNGFQRAAMLTKEAAIASDAAVNYALYDYDDDGYVDAFTCIHAGYGYEESNNGADIWSHAWDFNSAAIGEYTTDDGWPGHPGQYIKINSYTIDPERSDYSNHGTMVGIGVYCHEWGHALGLPDLYDTQSPGEGLGRWSLMGSGSWGGSSPNSPYYPTHLDPWCKMQLGWWNPRAVRQRELYSLPQVETNARGYWLMSRERTFREYFLVENRRRTLFDSLMYNSGLLIYHIDDSVIDSRTDDNRVNAGNGWPYGVALEQADGADHLYNGTNRGDANDPWPGGLARTLFDSTSTTPNSRTNFPSSGTLVSGCLAKNIPTSAPTVACTLSSGVVGAFTGGPDGAGYTWVDSDTAGGPTYGWNDISTTGALLGYGDDARWSFTLPFNLTFYGTTTSTVWVCTNGWLSFGSDPGTNQAANTSLPNSAAPNLAVYAYWEDLNVLASDSGGIYYRSYGTSPNCSTVVLWKNARVKAVPVGYHRPVNPISFEVVLYEQWNRAVVRYRDCAVGDTTYSWGRGATVGIENGAGTVGLQYLYNGAPVGNLLSNERAVDFGRTVIHDVGVVSITATTPVDSGQTVDLTATVHNFGTNSETFDVRTTISGSSYSQTRSKTVNAGLQDTVIFPSWTATTRGSHAVRCTTLLSGDDDPGNDLATDTVLVHVHDVRTVAILAPVGTIDSVGSTTPVSARVKNEGNVTESFDVLFRINSTPPWTSTVGVTDLAAGAEAVANFVAWYVGPRGSYTTACTTQLTGDLIQANDKLGGSFTVRVRDAAAVAILSPPAAVDSATPTTVSASVANLGSATEDIKTIVRIGSVYAESATANFTAGETRTVTLPNWNVRAPRGSHAVTCTTCLTNDADPANNAVYGSTSVRIHDVATMQILAPTGDVDSGAVVTPAAQIANPGTETETFNVRFTITDGYNGNVSLVLDAGRDTALAFPDWTAAAVGSFVTRCTTMLASDASPANNARAGTVRVLGPDVGVNALVAPAAVVDPGPINPTIRVTNYYRVPATFYTHCRIWRAGADTVYRDSALVTDLAGDSTTDVVLPTWNATAGSYVVRCSTGLDDFDPSNDTLSAACLVVTRDVGVSDVLSPRGVMRPVATAPIIRVSNYGSATETFVAGAVITDTVRGDTVYRDSVRVDSLAPGRSKELRLGGWTPALGYYRTCAWTQLTTDTDRSNDSASARVNVTPGEVGWRQHRDVPAGFRKVKHGGSLARLENQIYALKGNRTFEFYRYDNGDSSWQSLPQMPTGWLGRPVAKSADLCSDNSRYIYATKGNRTYEFWRYDVQGAAWTQLPDVPAGEVKLRGGTGLACVVRNDSATVYCLKGSGSLEFYAYNAVSGEWTRKADAPAGFLGRKFKAGSSLCAQSTDGLYAVKSSQNEFYYYDIGLDQWTALEQLPAYGMTGRRSRCKDGADLAPDGMGNVYAFCGGNRPFFFRYSEATGHWEEMTSLPYGPSGKKVKAGGSLVCIDHEVWALKGNNTLEFWSYTPDTMAFQPQGPPRGGVASGPAVLLSSGFSFGPNPARGRVFVRYSDPLSRPGQLAVLNVIGRTVATRTLRSGTATDIDLVRLPAGTYFLRLTTADRVTTAKLVLKE